MKERIIIVLSVLVLLLSGYLLWDSFTEGMSKAEIQTELNDLKSEYEFLQKDLEYNINSLNLNNKIFLAQKQKIETILKKNKITEAELEEAKRLMKDISKSMIEEYQKRVDHLQEEKQKLLDEDAETENLLKELNEKIAELERSRKDINIRYIQEKSESDRKTELLSYASSLTLSEFDLQGVKVRNSGKEVETDKASRIDRIKVSFTVNENQIAETGKKELYIIVRQPDGSVCAFQNATTGSFVSGNQKYNYSDKLILDYVKGEEKKVELEWNGEDFQRGDYVLEVYENNQKKVSKIGGAVKKLE
ncbi:MAG: hypothetical protein LBE36_07710 [Flavobacteriaceae bacterium]|jgi:hypothetical protein|nr:hypothetical protein [Flavobacteriaceae bacterium]